MAPTLWIPNAHPSVMAPVNPSVEHLLQMSRFTSRNSSLVFSSRIPMFPNCLFHMPRILKTNEHNLYHCFCDQKYQSHTRITDKRLVLVSDNHSVECWRKVQNGLCRDTTDSTESGHDPVEAA